MLLQTSAPSDWAMFFGHFHPVVVHLPIGMLMIAAILEFISRKKGLEVLQPAVAPILWWGMIFAIISCVFGYLLSSSGEYSEDTLFWHQWMGIGVALVALGAWYMKKNWQHDADLKKVYMPSIYGLVILLTGTGHLGGNMTHGEDYLYTYTPEPFRSIAGLPPRTSGTGGVKKIENIEQALVYQDIIAPVMEQKCWSCHNENKIKGQLRMDKVELLTKGGEHGAIFKANDPENSEMLKRVLLDMNDEHHMPPKGKTPLTEQEIALVHWWIKEGAKFDTKVAQTKPDEKIKPILAALAGGTVLATSASGGETISPVFSEKISAASEKDIKKLTDLNVIVMPVAKDQSFLDVNFINARSLDDSKIGLISNLSDQIVWLKLGNTKITDKSLGDIAKLKNLTRLNLEHTAVTDAGIAQLEDLKYLEYINLFDTKITDVGIKELAKLKGLKKVYCWQTKVTQAGVNALKKALPSVEVDMGWQEKTPVIVDSSAKVAVSKIGK
ncbi:MAG: c-type cytochrome domain-containing protein [Arcicella sp.]|nr:c-type cytochrome domain-containing protein [Arcicella sp.]